MRKKWFIVFVCSFSFSLFGQYSDSVRIQEHLKVVVEDHYPRNFLNPKVLDGVADYVDSVFLQYTDRTERQWYTVEGRKYQNVIASFGPQDGERIIVGAHYDVCGDQDGADDNASGLVGVLELARLLVNDSLKYRVDLVAYTLEEPPYFRTAYMGSYVHAKSLHDDGVQVKGMVCLEMIGYFDERKKSQAYPLGFLKLFYGSRGDYITVVSKFNRGSFARSFKRKMKSQKLIKTKAFQAPGALPGIDFSDHLNYWKFDFSAVMITNTGFYRNRNYHQPTDQIKTLDITRMAAVIDQVYLSLLEVR